jgi:hypothetical protein
LKFTDEEYRVIGNPSERMVQEAIYALAYDSDDDPATEDVVAKLMEWEDISEVQARQRVIDAIADAEVGITIANDLTAEIWLDPVTEARIRRRYIYMTAHDRGHESFICHFDDEQWIARCALRTWMADHDAELPTWDDLLFAISEHIGSEHHHLGPSHIALNALDAGAIYMTSDPTRSEVVYFDVFDDSEPEGLES